LNSAQAEGRNGSLIAIRVLQALILQAQGDMARALTFLEHALVLAEPEGYIRTFVDEGPQMATLLRKVHTRATMPDYVAKLLAAFRKDEGGRLKDEVVPNVFHPSSLIPQPLVEPLSKRELEILSLIAQGLTNIEIVQQIFISTHTVKVHTRNIYGKLDVNSRKQAVTKARTLGLLV
jgi:LuxR family maltose regulon positive regulatory protein